MLKIKGCPRCQGDVYQNRDIYGDYVECLQCGYMANLVKKPERARGISVPRSRKKAA